MNTAVLLDLKELLKHDLPQRVIQRGHDLARTNKVQIISDSEDHLDALVYGSSPAPYQIKISADDSYNQTELHAFECDCPYFEDRLMGCKHLVAVVEVALQLETQITRQTAAWENRLENIQSIQSNQKRVKPQKLSSKNASLRFILDINDILDDKRLALVPCKFTTKANGQESYKILTTSNALKEAWSPDDRQWLERLVGAGTEKSREVHNWFWEKALHLPPHCFDLLLPELLDHQKIYLLLPDQDPQETPPRLMQNTMHENWELTLIGEERESDLAVSGALTWKQTQRPLDEAALIWAEGLILWPNGISRLKDIHHYSWMLDLRKNGEILIPKEQCDAFLSQVFANKDLPKIELPEQWAFRQELRELEIHLSLAPKSEKGKTLKGQLKFQYDDLQFSPFETENPVYLPDQKVFFYRDQAAEAEALEQLTSFNAVMHPPLTRFDAIEWDIPTLSLEPLLEILTGKNWEILWQEQRIHQQGEFKYDIHANDIDWFDVNGSLNFEEEQAHIPELLKAIRKGSSFIPLKDGTLGWIPNDIREQLQMLAKMGTTDLDSGALQFKGAQSVLLDMMLSELPGVDWDQKAQTLQKKLRAISKPQAEGPSPDFKGELRCYQKEGLGWLRYLSEMGIQGCLADDMGLGKTIQVLALLQKRHASHDKPSLVVVPKSLIFNWQIEAEKFTPNLRICQLHGASRPKNLEELPEADLYLTSYPLVVRDIAWLKEKSFDYVILDESQAIKNAGTKTFKACRLLQGDHRLTMTGTPVENRLDDLWSQLEFLNPGLLGKTKFKSKDLSSELMLRLGKSLQPFLLRRCKEQVARDLPEKVEETLYCEMPPKQLKQYQELKKYYQAALQKNVKEEGLNKSKIIVLEALLRLRQAACHPGLLSEDHTDTPSGKFQMLQDLLEDILPTGHKVLIFSQFTQLLALVQTQMKASGYEYAYLDGKTKQRDEQIERFQSDPACQLFLISLKAGGVGLNLTAADYVILLDPWWNPAVEAQAVDRAHRIGQTKKVFAYRIVTKDTIEDKILQLQQEKKDLAEAILTQENSLISGLTPEDLDFLLS